MEANLPTRFADAKHRLNGHLNHMHHPFWNNNTVQPLPFGFARRLLILSIIFSMFVALAIAMDISVRSSHQADRSREWMQALNLSAPALWPAGTPMRHPEAMHPGVVLEFAPGLVSAP